MTWNRPSRIRFDSKTQEDGPVCNSPPLCRFTPTASTFAQLWWSTKPRPAALTRESPPTGWRTNWSQTTATSPPFPCTSESLSSGCPSRPPTQWLWSALGQESLPSWASSKRGAGSNSKVFIECVCVVCLFYYIIKDGRLKKWLEYNEPSAELRPTIICSL